MNTPGMIKEKITFRPGSLAATLEQWCDKHSVTPSEAIRTALSRMLRVKKPHMRPGNPEFGTQECRNGKTSANRTRQEL
jgi:hypothetical protein